MNIIYMYVHICIYIYIPLFGGSDMTVVIQNLFLGGCLWPSRAMIPAKEEECAFMLLRQPVGMGPSALLLREM